MAGEYSHEFSAKVFNGPSRLTKLGFWQGGPAGCGWSSCALHPLRLLERSERLLQLRADTILN
jgi:hypothetical protein